MRRGDRVETTGAGRTGRWGRFVGTVTAVHGEQVFVDWDACKFTDDEMSAEEVKPLRRTHGGCPCAQCRHS